MNTVRVSMLREFGLKRENAYSISRPFWRIFGVKWGNGNFLQFYPSRDFGVLTLLILSFSIGLADRRYNSVITIPCYNVMENCVVCWMAPISTTLSDPEGHFSCLKTFRIPQLGKCDIMILPRTCLRTTSKAYISLGPTWPVSLKDFWKHRQSRTL